MSELLDRPVEIRDVLATTSTRAGALDEPLRAALLDMMADGPMSIADMVEELERRGFEKAPTTVRHHVDVLRKAGLLELGRLEEDRGGVVKYYAATTRFFDYEEPEGFDEQLQGALDVTETEIAGLLERLREEHGPEIRKIAESLKPCEYCQTQHFKEYVLVRLLQRATASALHEPDDAGD